MRSRVCGWLLILAAVVLATVSCRRTSQRELRDTEGRMFEIAQGTEDPSGAAKGKRCVYFAESDGFIDCLTYERSGLEANNVIPGPAIVEQMDTTTVIPPHQKARVDRYGNIIIEVRV